MMQFVLDRCVALAEMAYLSDVVPETLAQLAARRPEEHERMLALVGKGCRKIALLTRSAQNMHHASR